MREVYREHLIDVVPVKKWDGKYQCVNGSIQLVGRQYPFHRRGRVLVDDPQCLILELKAKVDYELSRLDPWDDLKLPF